MSEQEHIPSVPVAAVMEASKAMLQKQLFAIFTFPVNGLGPILANMDEHLKFQIGLEREGIMFAAGPMWSDDGETWEGEGLVIVRAPSRDEAVAIAKRDPMHKAGARSFRVRPWLINEGTLTVRLDYSSQTFSIV
jgi:uncharacterized protein